VKLCFVVNHPKYLVGGAERQSLELARLLSARDFEVHVLSSGRISGRREVFEDSGVTVHVIRRRSQTALGTILQSIDMISEMASINADVYYQRVASALTWLVWVFTVVSGKRFVFGMSFLWDADLASTRRLYDGSWLDKVGIARALYRQGLLHAAAIIAQTNDQFRALGDSAKGRCTVVPSLSNVAVGRKEKAKPPFVLWLARMDWYKEPMTFIALAKDLPKVEFKMAGSGPLEVLVRREAEKIPNLSLLGAKPIEEADALCGAASLVVNTSVVEGFPNTLLQAAAQGTPFVSLHYDPDGVIEDNGLGVFARTFETLKVEVESLLTDEKKRSAMGEKGMDYVRRVHGRDRVAGIYTEILRRVG